MRSLKIKTIFSTSCLGEGKQNLNPSLGVVIRTCVLSIVLAGQALAQPVLSSGGIVNATGYQTTLAPDTVFVIFGSGMGPATLAGASAPNYPTSLGGTSVTFTPSSGGAAITAEMVYTSAVQVAALLPSSIAPGAYAVRLDLQCPDQRAAKRIRRRPQLWHRDVQQRRHGSGASHHRKR